MHLLAGERTAVHLLVLGHEQVLGLRNPWAMAALPPGWLGRRGSL